MPAEQSEFDFVNPPSLVLKINRAIGNRGGLIELPRRMIFEIEIDAELNQAAAALAGDFGDHTARFFVGHSADDRHAGLDDAGLFAAISASVFPKWLV